jgi:hypothetical protein
MIKEQDKEVLINSMKNLIKHIFQGPSHQTDIFKSLSLNDLNKIIDNLNDSNKSNIFKERLEKSFSLISL